MKTKHLFKLFIALTCLSVTYVQAQELYTQPNAAQCVDDVNSVDGWWVGGTDAMTTANDRVTITSSSEQAFAGNYSIRLEALQDGRRLGFFEVNLEIGVEYTVKLHAKADPNNTSHFGFYGWRGFANFQGQDATSTEWTEYTFVFTADETVGRINVYPAGSTSSTAGNVIYVDNISIYRTDSPPLPADNGGNNTSGASPWAASGNNIAFASGHVGIGTSNPDAALTVKGQVHSQEVKVDLLGALVPDYVFADNYTLLPLEEVAAFIEKEKHLPNIPSAKEIEKTGLLLKEMNLKLLEKIEELTLYTLEQQKQIEQLKKLEAKNKELEKAIEALQQTINNLVKQ